MINLTVITFKDRPVANLSASFDELGGSIGRSKTNQLVLPDPDRVVSRVHAKVVFRGGSYSLLACGGNPITHNGTPVSPGNEVVLSVGDRIQIEGYGLAVTPAQAHEGNDPFASLFEPQEGGAPRAVSAPPPSVPPARPARGGGPPAASMPAAPAKGGIPEDWDPFERDGGRSGIAPPDHQGERHSLLPQDLSGPAAPEDSIDSLFGLQDAGGGLGRVLGGPVSQPNTASHSDPLRSLSEPPRLSAMPEPDHVPDMNAPWVNKMSNEGSARTVVIPKGAVLSWAGGMHEARIGGKPPGPGAAFDPGAPFPATQRMEPRPPAAEVARQRPAPAPAARKPDAGNDELTAALLAGLGVPGLHIEQVTPELLQQFGRLLREATKGTVELLAIRAALKREIRADVTIIAAVENNPLKFSPNIDGAMQQMFGQKMPGFMSPVESMRDAFQDLRAHELGVMAGMKAALAGVLLRFDPGVLEGKLTRSSSLTDLIPAARKAKLWNLFETLYKQLAAEAEDDFNTLFGKAFVKAYEDYISQLEKQDKAD